MEDSHDEIVKEKKLGFIGNDTIAVAGLVAIAIVGLLTGEESVTSVAVGAIGGFIGSKTIN